MNMPKDKAKHLAVSFIITILLYMPGVLETGDVVLSAMGIGILKEVWDDRSGKGTPDYKDITANFIGVSIAYILIRLSLTF